MRGVSVDEASLRDAALPQLLVCGAEQSMMCIPETFKTRLEGPMIERYCWKTGQLSPMEPTMNHISHFWTTEGLLSQYSLLPR